MFASTAYLAELSKIKSLARFFTANGSPLMAAQQGTLVCPQAFLVPDVLHVRSLVLNLLSVGQLTNVGCIVGFIDRSCFVQDRLSGRMIGKDSRNDGLYTMQSLHLRSTFTSSPHPVPATVDLA